MGADPLTLARRAAGPYLRRRDRDEVLSDACLGVVVAERRYDPARGSNRELHAVVTARRHILDGLRERGDGRRVHNRWVPGESLPAWERPAILSDWTPGYWRDGEHRESASLGRPDPELAQVEARADVERLLDVLDARQRRVVAELYLRGRRVVEVAADLGVTAGRVCQIRSAALAAMRARATSVTSDRGRPQ